MHGALTVVTNAAVSAALSSCMCFQLFSGRLLFSAVGLVTPAKAVMFSSALLASLFVCLLAALRKKTV